MNVSILILTKNEQQDLPGCLESVKWSDDVHVYDSMSTDDTVVLAEQFGAKVTQRGFDDWASHQNWGLKNIPFKHEWVFYADADERVTPELVEAIQTVIKSPEDFVAFRVQRRDFFMGRWLKHVQTTPFYIRLFRPKHIRYIRLVNPMTIVDGTVGQVGGYLDHYPFSKGLTHWVDRHNFYSSFEARQIALDRASGQTFSLAKAFFDRDFTVRRFHQKELFYRCPFRPLLKFLILYGLKRGFLDGRSGFTYAILQSFYEYMIVLKTRELANKKKLGNKEAA